MNNITLFEAARLLLERNDFVLLMHGHPDGDTAGSAEALRLILEKLGKRVRVCCPDPLPRYLSFVPGAPLLSELPEKGTYIAIDIAELKLLGSFENGLRDKILLKIDHHRTGEDFAKYNYADPTAAAVGEIVYELSEMLEISSKEVGEALYTAIAGDTGCFRYSNTTSKTLLVASKLYDLGIDKEKLNSALFESKDPKTVKATALGIEKTEFLFDGKAAVVCFTAEMKEKGGFSEEHLSELSSALREIEGVELTAVLKQSGEDLSKFRLSTRSKHSFDCSALCTAFDGGGHLRAAGGTVTAQSPEEAVKRLKAGISKLWKNA